MQTASTSSRATTPRLELEPFQQRAWNALCGPESHVLVYGGARSGKTHLIVMWLVLRALKQPKATHIILRHYLSNLKASIIFGTLPEVCDRHWPGQKLYELNRSEWYADFVGGGRIYFGGLDDKKRTEKILGQAHSTVYLNEASQISYSSRLMAVTRLSQQYGLRLKEVCDENPPNIGHWTERLWVKGIEPSTGKPVADRHEYAVERMNPADNPHIPEATKSMLRAMPPRERSRFWDGKFGEGTEAPLWTLESMASARLDEPPALTSIVVAVDPSGCSGPEDKRSDEVGIVVVGLGSDGCVYILEDASGRFGPSGPDGWGARVSAVYHKWGADRVIGETNYGGAMVGAVMQTADANIAFREVSASRAKHVRAEPVAVLFDRKKAFFVGSFPDLEHQLEQFSTNGYMGDKSPDRADAMVWGVTALGVLRSAGAGLLEYYQQQAAKVGTPDKPAPSAPSQADAPIPMLAPPRMAGTFCSRMGAVYQIENGRVQAKPKDVSDLESSGFKIA